MSADFKAAAAPSDSLVQVSAPGNESPRSSKSSASAAAPISESSSAQGKVPAEANVKACETKVESKGDSKLTESATPAQSTQSPGNTDPLSLTFLKSLIEDNDEKGYFQRYFEEGSEADYTRSDVEEGVEFLETICTKLQQLDEKLSTDIEVRIFQCAAVVEIAHSNCRRVTNSVSYPAWKRC